MTDKDDKHIQLLLKNKRDDAARLEKEISRIEVGILEKQKELQALRQLYSHTRCECEEFEMQIAASKIEMNEWLEVEGLDRTDVCYPVRQLANGLVENIRILPSTIGSEHVSVHFTQTDPRRIRSGTRLNVLVQYGDLSPIRDTVLESSSYMTLWWFQRIDGKWCLTSRK